MNAKQFEKLTALLDEYAGNVPNQLAEARMEQIHKAGKNLHFAWAGGVERGEGHYYRIQAPTFLSNTIARRTTPTTSTRSGATTRETLGRIC